MKVLQKMNELVGANATKDQIEKWAYMNRIHVCTLHFETEFECLEKTVNAFYQNGDRETLDERDAWKAFLDFSVVD